MIDSELVGLEEGQGIKISELPMWLNCAARMEDHGHVMFCPQNQLLHQF